jgi:hypothetical protein
VRIGYDLLYQRKNTLYKLGAYKCSRLDTLRSQIVHGAFIHFDRVRLEALVHVSDRNGNYSRIGPEREVPLVGVVAGNINPTARL